MEETTKKASQSRTQQIQIIMPQNLNGAGRLFGGQLMSWIDVVAGIVAARHAGRLCTTASVDYLSFRKPVYPTHFLAMEGCITYVGNSSMEIRVDSYQETLTGERELTNRAYLTYVAINNSGEPVRVPRLELETEEEEREWDAGKKRACLRRKRQEETDML